MSTKNRKVKLRIIKLDKIKEYDFEHAQNILRIDTHNDFEVADSKYKFQNNELTVIKQSSSGASTKPKKQGKGNAGGEGTK